jgi:hypothetical protein
MARVQQVASQAPPDAHYLFDFSGNGSERNGAVSYSFEAEFILNRD